MGDGQLDPAEGKSKRAADVHCMRSQSQVAAVDSQFIRCNDQGVVGPGDADRIAEMIPMRMGQQNILHFDRPGLEPRLGIAAEKGIDDQPVRLVLQ
ncbi:MAG: hypothetical protein BWY83_02028 [bacterium ADurb.Bin478]|nr:MAG: hypothetical protein BWY83_02028 [bacterium ADurb.Bin478]